MFTASKPSQRRLHDWLKVIKYWSLARKIGSYLSMDTLQRIDRFFGQSDRNFVMFYRGF